MRTEDYNALFDLFTKVARQTIQGQACEDLWCREVFHDRVLRIIKIGDLKRVQAKLAPDDLRFKTQKDYENYLRRVFKNALIDQLRLESRQKKRSESLEPSSSDSLNISKNSSNLKIRELTDFPNEFECPEILESIVNELFLGLTREERRVISLYYGETPGRQRVILDDVAKVLGCSKSSVHRLLDKAKERLRSLWDKKVGEISDEHQNAVFASLLYKIEEACDE
jgi:RNA polymerase sigma factor (sigma-70 family)